MTLKLLLAHAEDNEPVLRQGIAAEALLGAPLPLAGQMPEYLWDVNHDPNDLSRQRWGIIAPAGGEGDRLLERVAPLRRVREEAQGAPATVYRVTTKEEKAVAGAIAKSWKQEPPKPVVDGPSAMRWKQETFRQEGGRESSLPRYLLLLGDLDQIPLELQQVLSTDAFVGRLAFPAGEEDKYTAYVNKVLRWERMSAREKKARMLFYTAWGGDEAIRNGYYELVDPCIKACRRGQPMKEFPMAEILELGREREVLREQFLAQVAELEPGILFSLSHGAVGGESLRERQGALSIPGGGVVMGKDVSSRPFLPGGIWFFFACFSAGTPARSSYAHWLGQLKDYHPEEARRITSALLPPEEKPFIAALPQAVLANPDGPLAVMGHADYAWTYSFKDHDRSTPSRHTPSRLLGVLKTLAEGGRAGVALHALQRFVNEASIELTLLRNRQEADSSNPRSRIDPIQWARLWMTRQDLSNYILLGDPAVRLPLELSQQQQPELQELHPPPIERRAVAEKAVLELLSGRSLSRVASLYQVPAQELRQWEQIFRAAGRAALDQHFSIKR